MSTMKILRLLILPLGLSATAMGPCEIESIGSLHGDAGADPSPGPGNGGIVIVDASRSTPPDPSPGPGNGGIVIVDASRSTTPDPGPGPGNGGIVIVDASRSTDPGPGPNVDAGPAPDAQLVFPGSITMVGLRGPGCPPGTASSEIAADGRTVEVTYDPRAFRSETGSLIEARRNCVAVLGLKVAPGKTFAVTAVTHTGEVALAEGVSAALRTGYHFTGGAAGPDATSETLFDNTDNGPFTVRGVFDPAQLQFAPCNAADPQLVINTEVSGDGRVQAGSSVAVQSSTFFEVTTRDCP
jgi:hypothetical protein